MTPIDEAVALFTEADVRESRVLGFEYLIGQLWLTDFASALIVHPLTHESKVCWLIMRGALASRGEL